uniref:Dephospho-CoA kinase n=1 Tax=Rhodosorus marinus TaxID=101924 RepID=A0A7S3E7D3_9RHOD|mmetsp:Transcript_11737/g.48775  ORF Transcript_11737/g.48775 Transcript_11737/m.48775 type:complete len:229 (+) Transcript_11737:237-923(+)
MPCVIGLTGSIATGKSSASNVFRSCSVPVVDADEIAKGVLGKGTLGLFLVRLNFGGEILREDGSLDRDKLGEMIFVDSRKRRKLNMCTHPLIILEMIRQLLVAVFVKMEPIVVLDTPLLYETKLLVRFCTTTLVIACSEEHQLSRLISRNNLSEEEARSRIASQMPISEKKRRASHVIDNDGTLEDLKNNVEGLISRLKPTANSEIIFRGLVVMLYSLPLVSLYRCLK